MDAAFAGNVAAIEVLVAHSADVNIVAGTSAKHTPLTRLCQYHSTIPKHEGHLPALKKLLAVGADPTVSAGPLSLTPLGYAAMGPLDDLVAILAQHLRPFDIWSAAVQCDLGRIRQLGKKQSLDVRDTEGRTPLHYVALSGLFKRVGSDKVTACADELLSHGIPLDGAQPIVEGDSVFHATALWYAVSWQNNLDLTHHFLKLGASPNPAVFSCLFEGDAAMCQLLADFGADWNTRVEGATPLMDLMKWNRPKMVGWLLDHGADPSLKDNDGLTALDHARKRKVRAEIIELLENALA